MNWIDVTNYSRDDTVRASRVWKLNLSKYIELTVHKYVGCGDAWFITGTICGMKAMDMFDPHTDSLDKAKAIAVSKFKDVLTLHKAELDAAIISLNNA